MGSTEPPAVPVLHFLQQLGGGGMGSRGRWALGRWASRHSTVPGCGAVGGRISGVLVLLVLLVLMGVRATKALYSARMGSLYIANWPRGCYGGMCSGGDG